MSEEFVLGKGGILASHWLTGEHTSSCNVIIAERCKLMIYRYMNCSSDGYFARGRHSRVALRILPHGTHLRVVRILARGTHSHA